MVLAGFKPVAGCREAVWVGSIPTRLRQKIRGQWAVGREQRAVSSGQKAAGIRFLDCSNVLSF